MENKIQFVTCPECDGKGCIMDFEDNKLISHEQCTYCKGFGTVVKNKYLYELFPDGDLPFPYGEKDCADFDVRDTFSLNSTLIAWLYERLRYFQDEASQIIDFDQPLYLYGEKALIDGHEVTQRECIDRMVEDCKTILLFDSGVNFDDWKEEEKYVNDVVDPAKNDLFMVLSKVYWALWW